MTVKNISKTAKSQFSVFWNFTTLTILTFFMWRVSHVTCDTVHMWHCAHVTRRHDDTTTLAQHIFGAKLIEHPTQNVALDLKMLHQKWYAYIHNRMTSCQNSQYRITVSLSLNNIRFALIPLRAIIAPLNIRFLLLSKKLIYYITHLIDE